MSNKYGKLFEIISVVENVIKDYEGMLFWID